MTYSALPTLEKFHWGVGNVTYVPAQGKFEVVDFDR